MGFGEDAGGGEGFEFLTHFGDAVGAGHVFGADGDRAGDVEIEAALEILVGVVEDDEGQVLDRREFGRDIGDQPVEGGVFGLGVGGVDGGVFGVGAVL